MEKVLKHLFEWQVWVIWTGSGSNGKGLLLAMLEALLGPVFFKTAKKEVFFKADRGRAAGAAEPHLVELRGARIAAKDESSAANQLDIEHIKSVTGQSSLTVRDNYQGYVTFKPTFIPLLLCNELPPHQRGREERAAARGGGSASPTPTRRPTAPETRSTPPTPPTGSRTPACTPA